MTETPALAPSTGLAALQAIDPRAGAFACFPLRPIVGGACSCALGEACAAKGKHPAVTWSDLRSGQQVAPEGAQGLGIVTGSRSGGLVVLDIDDKPGADGFTSLETLETRWGPLPPTLSVRSPSGGLHLYLHHPGLFQSNQGAIGKGLDIRGEGGMVVGPGSAHRKGGTYTIEDARPIALLPTEWADRLPRARAGTTRAQVTSVPVEATTLRQRLSDAVKGRRGGAWAALRAAVTGDRMFRIEGGPGPATLEIVHGVDVFMSQQVLFTLAREDDWHTVPGDAIGALLASSLATLDQDCHEATGRATKWTPEHVSQVWARAVEVVAGEIERAQDFMRAMDRAVEVATVARSSPLPLVVQQGNTFAVLDDSDPARPRYTDFEHPAALYPIARQLWTGTDRVLERATKEGTRPMTAPEIAEIYGRAVSREAVEFTIRTPRVDGLTLIRGLEGTPPDPVYDVEVAAWLDLLDPTRGLLDWLWWAKPERCAATAPALAIVGASWVGKTALAEGVAVAAGQARTVALERAVMRFAGSMAIGPITFSDEGLPKDHGRLMTEEFRRLLTTTEHRCEEKGKSARKDLIIRGGVRVILAANSGDRLFAGGNLSADDVAALTRRLFVIDIRDEARAAAARAAVIALGSFEQDPRRLARIAGHVRAVQEARPEGVPEIRPRGGSLEPALRRSGDLASAALDAISDAAAASEAWVARDRGRGVLWVQSQALTARLGLEGKAGALGPVMRAIRAYIRVNADVHRAHPVTGVSFGSRERWVGLSLDLLTQDGITDAEVPT